MMLENSDSVASGGTTAFLKKEGGKGVVCPKCSHVNRPHSGKCSRCGTHLYVKCKDCGAHNERVHSDCQTCGRRLHKSAFEKVNSRIFKRSARVTPFQVVLMILFAAAAFYFVIMIGKLEFPTLR